MDKPIENNEEKGFYATISELRLEVAKLVIRQFNNSLIIQKLINNEEITNEDREFLSEQEAEFKEIEKLSKKLNK